MTRRRPDRRRSLLQGVVTLVFGSACFFVVTCFSPLARAEIAGRYKTTGQNISVKVQSWGEDCGPRPRSASGGGGKVVDVRRVGAHLSIGGHRTDRCWSRNPRVQRRRAQAGTNRWTVVCETPAGDSRFEHGEYTVDQPGEGRLRFREVSRYDWRLEGDHCQATVVLTRNYTRVDDAEPEQLPPEQPDRPEPQEPPTPSKCAGARGDPVRLDVRPRRVRIGPGERVCLRAVPRDRDGCPVPGSVSWERARGPAALGRLTEDGCFTAGNNASGAEGMVAVTARVGELSGAAQIVVRIPDISDLIAERLTDGSEEEPALSGNTQARPGSAQGLGRAQAEPVRGASLTLWALLGGIFFALFAVVLVIVVARRRRASTDEGDDEAIERVSSTMAVASSVPPPTLEEARKRCPACGRIFTDSTEYCPDDATKLVAAPVKPVEKRSEGSLICPKCRRGYEGGERFCSFDHEELIPYKRWREMQLEARNSKKKSGGGMICPKCSERYDEGILFCQKDGTKLEPIN